MNNASKLKHIIFSYGSNMLNHELVKYCNLINKNNCNNTMHSGFYEVLDIGILSKYRFAYKNMCMHSPYKLVKTAKATIIPDKNAKVYGTITRVSSELFQLIVKKEGIVKPQQCSHYKMKTLKVRSATQDKSYNAVTFIMLNPVTDLNTCEYKLYKNPTLTYEKKVVDAAKWYKFPIDYIETYLIQNK
jgi:hypothetical protein